MLWKDSTVQLCIHNQIIKAINDFTDIIKLQTDNANAYFNRGCCYDQLGKLDLAIADYSKALELENEVNK